MAITLGVVVAALLMELLQIFALVVGGAVMAATTVLLARLLYPWRMAQYRRLPCPHGIVGGQTEARCSTCRALSAEKEANARAQLEAEQRAAALRTRSRELREEERRRLRATLADGVAQLRAMSPQRFEDRIAELYRALGYDVKQTPYTGDRGRDAVLRKEGRTYLVECKRYKEGSKTGRRDLMIFYAAIVEAKAERGFFVTTGAVTREATKYAADKPIDLIEAKQLMELMARAYPDGVRDEYRVLCEYCGTTLVHRLRVGGSRQCTCGASVLGSLTPGDLYPEAGPRKKPSPRRRGRRR